MLCRVLQWTLSFVPTSASFISHVRGTEPRAFHEESDPMGVHFEDVATPSIKLQLQGHVECRAAKSLLEPFSKVIFGQSSVKVLDVQEDLREYAQWLKIRISPRFIWTNAMAWHMLYMIRDMFQHAEGDLANGGLTPAHFKSAIPRYRAIWLLSDTCSIFHSKDSTYHSDIAAPFGILVNTLVKAAFTDTLLSIQLANLDKGIALHRLHVVPSLMCRPTVLEELDEGLSDTMLVLSRWHDILCRFLVVRTEDILHHFRTQMRSLVQDMDETVYTSDLQGYRMYLRAYLETDQRLIELCAEDEDVRYITQCRS